MGGIVKYTALVEKHNEQINSNRNNCRLPECLSGDTGEIKTFDSSTTQHPTHNVNESCYAGHSELCNKD